MTGAVDLAATARQAPPHTGFRVLVVDDDPDMAAFLGRLLAGQGMAVESVCDGESVMRSVMAAPPDLVVLDVMLPGISGFQAGADDFLSKPVRREELLARVHTLRRLHETRRELEARRLAAEVQRKEAIRKAFSRYVSPRLAERIIGELGSERAAFGDAHRTEVVALFADLRGFTRLTESVEVGEVVGMLNEYFSVITEAAYRNEGTIFSMAGDSLLVGFNVPFPQPDAPLRAWRTAQDMVASFAPVLARWTQRGGMPTGIGLGIAAGEAIVGNVGSPHYMSYTVIGDAVNTAARLTQMANAGELLVSGAVYEAIRGAVPAGRLEPRGNVALRGKSEAIAVYSTQL
jgi:adenylate cyclase